MELILDGDEKNHPSCPHGPTFLFKKTDVERHTLRKFYACSANRNRKYCQFFHWFDQPITPQKRKTWESIARNHLISLKLDNLRARHEKIERSPPKTRLQLCRKCSLLLFPDEWSQHGSHGPLQDVGHKIRTEPTTFLSPLEENKTNAQYFFSDNSVSFITESLKQFEVKKVLCIGTPRIFEYILSRKADLNMECLLMDIDHRYAQFYSSKNFILYNMFNHHFFEGALSQKNFVEFVRGPEKTALVIDPPFGGMVSAIAHTVKKISDVCGKDQMPILLFYPYFNEDRILKEMPTLTMLDYKVNYINHSKFKEGKTQQGSVVRIYTNMDAARFVLPASEGYRFCSICQRYVSKENNHCLDCNSCTSKDGRSYRHCKKCGQCHKSSWQHCPLCDRCALPDHTCQTKQKPTRHRSLSDESTRKRTKR